MNTKLTGLLLFLALCTAQLTAQTTSSHFTARERGWWTFGLDGGLAYQSSDVRTQFNGWGVGATLGKNLLYRPGGMFSFDLRGRGLFTRSYGADAVRSYGLGKNEALNGGYLASLNYDVDQTAPNDSSFVYHNYRHSMGELGVEGVLTFNRLRERTGVVFALFGGIGLDFYRTRTDQLANGQTYNYLGISSENSKKIVLADLQDLRDGIYESPADGFTAQSLKAGLMPGAGIELGYQVAPRFVIGIGHKITFSRTDILDGEQWTDNNTATGDNDWQHYTNLHLRWDITRRERRVAAPRIEIINPGTNPYITSYANENLRARIQNVHAYSEVQCYLNGNNQTFTFNNGRLSADLRLRPGRNEARIVASNPAGRDEKTIIIVLEDRYSPPTPPPPPVTAPPPPPPVQGRPELRIVEPSRSPYTTDRDNISLIAQLRNISDRRELRLLVNGADERFTLAEGLEANVRLREGRNSIRVEANTAGGRASDEIEVIYQRNTTSPATPPSSPSGQRPVVRITQPRSTNESVAQAVYTLKATVEQVDSRDDITVYLNGTVLRNTSFDVRSRVLSAELNLQTGANSITIRARNRYGEGEASTSVTQKVIVQKPDVTITEPLNGAGFTQPTAQLRATTQYVSSRNEITVELNRRTIPFNFDQNNGAIRADLLLQEGDNNVVIVVRNSAGSDQASVTLQYAAPKPPKITITAPANNSETRDERGELNASLVHVNNKNEVSVLLNGVAIPFTFDPKRKLINAKPIWVAGNNTLRVSARTTGGADDASVAVRWIKTSPPVVTIINPKSKKGVTDKAGFNLSARVEHVFSDKNVEVLMNGAPVPGFTLDKGGNLSANVILKPGDNTFVVKASTPDGKAEASAGIQYDAPVLAVEPKPELAFLVPKRSGLTVSALLFELKATAKNVTIKSQIKLKLNGQDIRAFEFNARSTFVTASLNLKEGKNYIILEATNSGGSTTIQAEINYQPGVSVPKPEVSIETASQPTVSPFNPNEGRSSVVANVRYIDQKEQISIKINDVPLSDFTFTPATSKVVWVAVLRKGDNRIEITVTNAAGTATATQSVKFD